MFVSHPVIGRQLAAAHVRELMVGARSRALAAPVRHGRVRQPSARAASAALRRPAALPRAMGPARTRRHPR